MCTTIVNRETDYKSVYESAIVYIDRMSICNASQSYQRK